MLAAGQVDADKIKGPGATAGALIVVLRRSLANIKAGRLEELASIAKNLTAVPVPLENETPPQTLRQYKHFKPDEVEAVTAKYQQGATVYELAEEFTCHRTTISKLLKQGGVAMRRTGLTGQQTETAVHMYEQGLSAAAIGDHLGVSPQAVLNGLRQRHVRIRPRGGSHGWN